MKILKILLILLVPAIGFVGCQKSNVHPKCSNNNSSTSTEAKDSQGSKLNTNVAPVGDNTYNSTDVVGSGDDDRDGGDKPKKIGSK